MIMMRKQRFILRRDLQQVCDLFYHVEGQHIAILRPRELYLEISSLSGCRERTAAM